MKTRTSRSELIRLILLHNPQLPAVDPIISDYLSGIDTRHVATNHGVTRPTVWARVKRASLGPLELGYCPHCGKASPRKPGRHYKPYRLVHLDGAMGKNGLVNHTISWHYNPAEAEQARVAFLAKYPAVPAAELVVKSPKKVQP